MLPRALTDFARDAVAPIRARKLRREAEEELVDHMAEIYAQDLATGMSEEDAAGDAVARMGTLRLLQSRYADLYGNAEPRPMHVAMDCALWGLLLSHLWLFSSPNTDLLFQAGGGLLLLFALGRLQAVSSRLRKIYFLQPATLLLQIAAYGVSLYFGLSSVPAMLTHMAAWLLDGIFLCALYPALCEIYNAAYEPGDSMSPGIFPALFLLLFSDYFAMMGWWQNATDTPYLVTLQNGWGSTMPVFMVLGAVLFVALFSRVRRVVCSGEPEETRLDPLPKKAKRRFLAAALAFLLLPGVGMLTAALRAPQTEAYVQADVQSPGADAAREHLVSLGLPAEIAADLPDSEALLYADTATMQVILDGYSSSAGNADDPVVHGYQFWGTDWTEPVRTLFCFTYPETYGAPFSEAFYFCFDWDAFSWHQSEEAPPDFALILAEQNGETVRCAPLQTSPVARVDFSFRDSGMIGATYAFPRASTGRRAYFAASRDFMGGDGWGKISGTDGVYTSQRLPFSADGLDPWTRSALYFSDRKFQSSVFLKQRQIYGYAQNPIDAEHFTDPQPPVF